MFFNATHEGKAQTLPCHKLDRCCLAQSPVVGHARQHPTSLERAFHRLCFFPRVPVLATTQTSSRVRQLFSTNIELCESRQKFTTNIMYPFNPTQKIKTNINVPANPTQKNKKGHPFLYYLATAKCARHSEDAGAVSRSRNPPYLYSFYFQSMYDTQKTGKDTIATLDIRERQTLYACRSARICSQRIHSHSHFQPPHIHL